MSTSLNFAPLCSATNLPRSHKEDSDCRWAEYGGHWHVLVDLDTGAAFTVWIRGVIWDDGLVEAREAWEATARTR